MFLQVLSSDILVVVIVLVAFALRTNIYFVVCGIPPQLGDFKEGCSSLLDLKFGSFYMLIELLNWFS